MIWVRFPFKVKYDGKYYAANREIPVSDDDLAQLEAKGAKIVRAVYEPENNVESKAAAVATNPEAASKKTAQTAAAPKRRGRKPKNA